MKLKATLTPSKATLKANFKTNDMRLDAGFNGLQVVTKAPAHYEGEYKVTPAVTAQTLETKDKLMDEDLTIKAIPYYDTSNTAGGITVYIGKELD